MRLIGIGLAAALAFCALAPAAYAADKSPPIDAKARADGMKAAPAVVTATGVACTVTDAVHIGDDPSTKVSYYEVACQEGLGYVLGAGNAKVQPVAETCLEADRPMPDGKPSPVFCKLPGNVDPKVGLAPYVVSASKPCTVAKARSLGHGDKNSFFEVACQEGDGYIVQTGSPPKAGKDVALFSCLAEVGTDVACTLTDTNAQLAVADDLVAKAGKACTVNKRRYIGANPSGSEFFEVACADGKGYVVERTSAGALGHAVDCAAADTFVEGGCSLTDARAAQTEQADLYTKLAKRAGFDCDVEKYGALNGNAGEDVVELQCKNRPDGAIAVFKANSAEIYDCARSELMGRRCSFTHADADNDHLTADLKTKGKTECVVSSSRAIGMTTDQHGYVEVACADGLPGWVIEYTFHPQQVVAVLNCGLAAGIGSGCQLPTNKKK